MIFSSNVECNRHCISSRQYTEELISETSTGRNKDQFVFSRERPHFASADPHSIVFYQMLIYCEQPEQEWSEADDMFLDVKGCDGKLRNLVATDALWLPEMEKVNSLSEKDGARILGYSTNWDKLEWCFHEW